MYAANQLEISYDTSLNILATLQKFAIKDSTVYNMNANPMRVSDIPEASLKPINGLHACHYFYRWDRFKLQLLLETSKMSRRAMLEQFTNVIDLQGNDRTERYQSYLINGHKADFALILMDSDPLKIDRIHQRLLATRLGAALEQTYSYVSVSEVSEYLPDKDEYAQKLIRSGEDPESAGFQAKVGSYEKRLPIMLAQRLAPDFPDWPAMCFYPMSKSREADANWFTSPYSERAEMMSEHARSGMAFAGRVTQLVTGSAGLDDYEWSVTLWAKNPQYLKEIVYDMRFDKASARFALFGPFYSGYIANAGKIIEHCQLDETANA